MRQPPASRIRDQVVEDLSVEDLDRAVIRTRRHERVPV